jgi:hypothetical protein
LVRGEIIMSWSKSRKLSKKKIAELKAELSVPHITASALRAMHNIENKDDGADSSHGERM